VLVLPGLARCAQDKFAVPGKEKAARMAMKQWNFQMVFESAHEAAHRWLAEAESLVRMDKRPRRRRRAKRLPQGVSLNSFAGPPPPSRLSTSSGTAPFENARRSFRRTGGAQEILKDYALGFPERSPENAP
jgi:hypothetical protein